MKTLVAFGCSFTYGTGLPDTTRESVCYPALIAHHYGLNLVNLAYPGGSQERMRRTLHWYEKTYGLDDCFILSALAPANRMEWFPTGWLPIEDAQRQRELCKFQNGHSNINQNGHAKHCQQTVDAWIKYFYSEQWEEYNSWLTISSFKNAAKNAGAPLLQFHAESLKTVVGPTDDLEDFDFQTIANIHPGTTYSCGHFNEKGHALQANYLIEYIDKHNILSKT